jgi:hypothetical protein
MEEDDRLIAQLREAVASVEDRLTHQPKISPSSAAATAKRMYRARRVRDQYFSKGLFRDPGWDILLDLYIARHDGRDVTISAACIGAAVPATTGLRWLRRLEEEGLLYRRRLGKDDRVSLVDLTDEGLRQLELVLAKLEGR